MLGSYFGSRGTPVWRPFAPALFLSALALGGCAGQTGSQQFSWATQTSLASPDVPQRAEPGAGFASAAQSTYPDGSGWGPYSGARQAMPPANDVYVYRGGDTTVIR